MARYSWRTWEWKVGDRCVVRAISLSGFKGTVTSLEDQYVRIKLDDSLQSGSKCHRAECIPLRKKEKPKLREWWLGIAKCGMATYQYRVSPNEGAPAPRADNEEIIRVREVGK